MEPLPSGALGREANRADHGDRCVGRSATARGSGLRRLGQRKRLDGDDRDRRHCCRYRRHRHDRCHRHHRHHRHDRHRRRVARGLHEADRAVREVLRGARVGHGRQRRTRPRGNREGVRGVRRRGAGGDPRRLQDRRRGVCDLCRGARGHRSVVRRDSRPRDAAEAGGSSGKLDDTKLTAASAEIEAWAKANCTGR